MTLVLAYVDDGVTVQVADRRLSVRDGSTYRVVTDDAVKVEVQAGTFLISFSGRSEVATKPTLEWLAAQFDSALDMSENVEQIAGKLDQIFARRRYADHVLNVMLSGWALREGVLTPFVAAITNQDPVTFDRLPTFKHPAVRLHDATDPPARSAWLSTGRLSDAGHAAVDRWVKAAQHRELSPVAVLRVFAYQVRAEARRDVERTIGESLRVAVLPRAVVDEALREGAKDLLLRHHRDGVYVRDQAMTVDLAENQTLDTMTVAQVLMAGGGPSWFGSGPTTPVSGRVSS